MVCLVVALLPEGVPHPAASPEAARRRQGAREQPPPARGSARPAHRKRVGPAPLAGPEHRTTPGPVAEAACRPLPEAEEARCRRGHPGVAVVLGRWPAVAACRTQAAVRWLPWPVVEAGRRQPPVAGAARWSLPAAVAVEEEARWPPSTGQAPPRRPGWEEVVGPRRSSAVAEAAMRPPSAAAEAQRRSWEVAEARRRPVAVADSRSRRHLPAAAEVAEEEHLPPVAEAVHQRRVAAVAQPRLVAAVGVRCCPGPTSVLHRAAEPGAG